MERWDKLTYKILGTLQSDLKSHLWLFLAIPLIFSLGMTAMQID